MTKDQHIELLQRHLAGGEVPADVRGKYHQNVVGLYLGLAYNTALFELSKMALAVRDSAALDQYTKSFDIPKADIKCDEKSETFYMDLPASLPQMIGGQAIRYVGSAKKGSRGWLYRSPGAHDIFNELDVNLVDQSPRFSPEGDRLFIYNLLETNFPDYIRVKMITTFEDYDGDDDLPMPGGQDAVLFPEVVKLMMTISKEELINDNQINAEASERR